jgi:two-component system nitrogen regulation response regulator NtrX
MAGDILVVDDEADIRDIVAGILDDEGYGTRTARNSDEALTAIEARRPSLVFLDIWLQGSPLDGLQLLDVIRGTPSRGAGRHDLGPRQHRNGGLGHQARRLRLHREAVQGRPPRADRRASARDLALRREVKELKRRISGEATDLIGKSSAMNQLRQTIERVAPTNSRTMISGPPAAGKELVARTIHSPVAARQRAVRRHQRRRHHAGAHGGSSCSASRR